MNTVKVTLTEDKGAPAALRSIAEQESQAREDHKKAKAIYDEAVRDQLNPPAEKDGTDFGKIVQAARQHLDDCESRWQRWLKHLREFDRSVSEDKRDVSEAITKDVAQKTFFHAAVALNQAMENFITRAMTDIAATDKNEQALFAKLGKGLKEAMVNAVRSSIQENYLPKYVLESIEEGNLCASPAK